MKFRSLIFREFRISKKSIILQFGLLFAWIALVWGMLLSSDANEFTGEELSGTADIIIMMTAMIASMSLLMDEIFKSDINSGWLKYSYALPITPLERTAARFVSRFSVCLVSILLSLCNCAALCASTGNEFGVNYIAWHIIVFALVILTSLPNEIFMLRSRSGDDMKKKRTTAGMATMAVMIVLIVVIFIASGVDLKTITEIDALFELPVFTASALGWAVPLLLVMLAASFFAAYYSMRSAYLGAASSKNNDAEIEPQAALTTKSDGAVGLLYKELKQNRLVLILAAVTPILLTAFPFCFSAIEVITNNTEVDALFETAANVIIRVLMCVTGIFVVSGLMSEAFNGDDKKLWAYFVISAPHGVKGFLYRKYLITLMINLIYMVSGIFADNLLATVHYFATGTELTVSMSSLYLSGVFILMSVSALDIPFMVRYGSKKGSIVKMIIMLSICGAGITVFNLLPDDIRMRLTETVSAFFNGSEVNDVLLLILSIIPFIAFAAFLFSYKIACGVFMKGVNEYDK